MHARKPRSTHVSTCAEADLNSSSFTFKGSCTGTIIGVTFKTEHQVDEYIGRLHIEGLDGRGTKPIFQQKSLSKAWC